MNFGQRHVINLLKGLMWKVGGGGERGLESPVPPPRLVAEDSTKFEFDVCSLSIFVVSLYKIRLMREFKPIHKLMLSLTI